jgi:hypothetical protein
MTICSGTGLLSQMIERGLVAGSCRWSERARGLVTLPVCVCIANSGASGRAGSRCRRVRCLSGLGGGEQVVGAGEQLAGDRDGGDLLTAALSDGGVSAGELRGALGGLRCLVQDPAQSRRALLGNVPVPDGQVRAADRRGQPGPAGQLAGTGEPGDVTDLGQYHQSSELADAWQRPEHLDPRVCFRTLVQLAAGAARSPARGRRWTPGSR